MKRVIRNTLELSKLVDSLHTFEVGDEIVFQGEGIYGFVAKLSHKYSNRDEKQFGTKAAVAGAFATIALGPIAWPMAVALGGLGAALTVDHFSKKSDEGLPVNLTKIYDADFRVSKNDELNEEITFTKLASHDPRMIAAKAWW